MHRCQTRSQDDLGGRNAAASQLPLHHSDPFDRFVLAQDFLEPLRFVTRD
jgi:PIN domain nuclease of toxin-antitoxin system